MEVGQYAEELQEISSASTEEYGIEMAADAMEEEWKTLSFNSVQHKHTGTQVITEESLRCSQQHVFNMFSIAFPGKIGQTLEDLRREGEHLDHMNCIYNRVYILCIYLLRESSQYAGCFRNRQNPSRSSWNKRQNC